MQGNRETRREGEAGTGHRMFHGVLIRCHFLPNTAMKQLTKYRLALSTLLPVAAIAGACAPAAVSTPTAPAPASTGANPFFVESTLPYHAPRFDLIRNEHYQPALEEGMQRQLAEIDAIAKQTVPPSFDNTIVAMERSGALLTRVAKTFSAVTQ